MFVLTSTHDKEVRELNRGRDLWCGWAEIAGCETQILVGIGFGFWLGTFLEVAGAGPDSEGDYAGYERYAGCIILCSKILS